MLRTPPQNTIVIDDGNANGKGQNATTVDDMALRCGKNSRKVQRSPIKSASREMVSADGQEKEGTGICNELSTPKLKNTEFTELLRVSTSAYSPSMEQITRMREVEEECLRRCVAIIRNMERAIERQKNISKEVKDGVSVLNEQFDVIESCRRSWKELESARYLETEKALRKGLLRSAANVDRTQELETPVAGGSKRVASSSVVPEVNKKIKENGNGGWQTVTYRREKNKTGKGEQTPATAPEKNKSGEVRKTKRSRKQGRKLPDAVLIRPTEGRSYAEVLKDLKTNVKPEDAEIAIRSIRKTKNGSILLELEEGGSKDKFCEAIKSSLKEAANVSTLKPKTTIEIRDLDALSESDEVCAAVRELIQSPDEEVSVRVAKANAREQRRAFITLATEKAVKIIDGQRIKVGWTYCKVRKVSAGQRCFKCFGVGHTQWSCKGPDRKGLCIRCGQSGHFVRDCTHAPRCCICVDEGRRLVDHIPGTSRCAACTGPIRSR